MGVRRQWILRLLIVSLAACTIPLGFVAVDIYGFIASGPVNYDNPTLDRRRTQYGRSIRICNYSGADVLWICIEAGDKEWKTGDLPHGSEHTLSHEMSDAAQFDVRVRRPDGSEVVTNMHLIGSYELLDCYIAEDGTVRWLR